jgi:hypothetical protein
LPAVVDNVILSVFVDTGQGPLLAALAGQLWVTPTILDPLELPPFSIPPTAEFSKGLYNATQDLADARKAERAQQRSRFFAAGDKFWQAVELSGSELALAMYLVSKQAREDAQNILAARGQVLKAKRVDPGEAECAAVAVSRGWRLFSDDGGIYGLLKALYPTHPVERSCGLLVQAVRAGLLPCKDAAVLYNDVFKKQWTLHTTLEFRCIGDKPSCQ